jgi:hypothetical protein
MKFALLMYADPDRTRSMTADERAEIAACVRTARFDLLAVSREYANRGVGRVDFATIDPEAAAALRSGCDMIVMQKNLLASESATAR